MEQDRIERKTTKRECMNEDLRKIHKEWLIRESLEYYQTLDNEEKSGK